MNDTISLANFTYRYIRMRGVTRSNTASGYVINEFEVFGKYVNPCATPTNLSASSVGQNSATLNWTSVSGANSYNFQYKTSLVSSWVTGSTTSESANISALSCESGYTYQVQAVCATGSSDQASGTLTTNACTNVCGSLHTRYFNADIGSIGMAGSTCLQNDIYTLQGSGTGIGGNSDEFQYAFTNLNGDESISAEVLSQDASSPNNKVGLMFRDSVSNTSPFVMIATTSGNGIVFEYRSGSGAATTTITIPNLSAPYWLMLEKNGTEYTAYISPTGLVNSWVQVGSTVNLGFGNSPVYVGMAISSSNNSALSTATISGYTETPIVLPVNLISFIGNNVGNQYVDLKWVTSNEINSKYFNVQRSADGIQFQNFTQVNAADYSNTSEEYTAIDYHPNMGVNFYRLQEVDNTGNVSYSPIVLINFGANNGPQLFPNPAQSYFTVSSGQAPVKEIDLIDVAGKTILHKTNTNGSSAITLSTGNLAAGIYIVQIKTETKIYQQKLIKQ